jgi:hypothetical protein
VLCSDKSRTLGFRAQNKDSLPLFGFNLSNSDGNNRLLSFKVAFFIDLSPLVLREPTKIEDQVRPIIARETAGKRQNNSHKDEGIDDGR